MKKVLFITVCLLAAITAQAQNTFKTSYSGINYWSSGPNKGKLYDKEWVSTANGNIRLRSERPDEQTGETTITIFRQDSAKFYLLKPAKKTAMVLPMKQIKGGMNSILGLDVEKSRTSKLELLGRDVINGYECIHYLSTSVSTLKTGTEDTGCFEYWLYEPLGVQMQHKEGCGFMPTITLSNFQQGPQPDPLFEIPKGYQVTELPLGGLMEMITGNSREQNQKDADSVMNDLNKKSKDLGNKMNEALDPNKSKEQQLQDMIKLMNESIKKK